MRIIENFVRSGRIDRLVLLHALRLALIHRIWLLAVALPEFSPRHGATREALVRGILQLDVDRALALLADVFPAKPDPSSGLDFHEPSAPRSGGSYAAEHATLFQPMGALFALPVYLQPMATDTGWTRAGISTAMTIGFVVMGFAGFGWWGMGMHNI